MTASEPPFWESIGFEERLAAWIESERPADDIVNIVKAWIDRQLDYPYRGVRRVTEIAANLWYGRVPYSYRDGTDVFCSYWIDEELRQIRCDSIATLSRPN